MALLTISVRRDPGTGRPDILIGLESDADALPHEHESLHGRLIAALLPGADVARERPAKEPVVG